MVRAEGYAWSTLVRTVAGTRATWDAVMPKASTTCALMIREASLTAATSVTGGRWACALWDSVLFAWRAPRPPRVTRVVFVLGFASLISNM
eukprot:scaffold46904_cov42-Phaeocystis_antarctica.AAC.2